MKRFRRRRGLRSAITASFVIGALLLAVLMAFGTWTATSQIMVRQRLNLSERQARNTAVEYLSELARGASPTEAVDAVSSEGVVDGVLVGSTWIIAPTGFTPSALTSPELQAGTSIWTAMPSGERATLVRVNLPDGSGDLYELAETTELNGALTTMAGVLSAGAVVMAIGGLAIGMAVARSVLKPLDDIGAAAGRIRGGDLSQRIRPTADPDLAPIITSFNEMVATLEQRIQRDSRFAADVSHELRSPLTTLIASVDLLNRRRETLDAHSRVTLSLMSRELHRLNGVLEDLIELGRLETEGTWTAEVADLVELTRHVLVGLDQDPDLLDAPDGRVLVDTDGRAVGRSLANLVRNADLHGRGIRSVQVRREPGCGLVRIIDAGPGVAQDDRERIFDRFVRGGTRRDLPGSGLGLSIVAETMIRAGGSVRCVDTPGGGATFEVRLPSGEVDGAVAGVTRVPARVIHKDADH